LKWTYPAGAASVMPAHGYLVVFCDGSPPGATGLHASFSLKPDTLGLVLNKGSELFFADASTIEDDRSLGRAPDGDDRISALESPTPGSPNSWPVVKSGPIRGD